MIILLHSTHTDFGTKKRDREETKIFNKLQGVSLLFEFTFVDAFLLTAHREKKIKIIKEDEEGEDEE